MISLKTYNVRYDTSLYIIVENPAEAAQMLNSDMEKINQWAKRWLVSFNPAKSESLLFSRNINKPYHPPVTMNNHQSITEVTTHKHLGLTFSLTIVHGMNIKHKLKQKLGKELTLCAN